ncbi:MAG: YdcH family protein [Verrucomicrobiales bacterium]|nr:YdcH family protein [Verrucomicrobiales bacterium]MEC5125693.1 YdcH family protein [Verrucomicrobiales bacterium BCK34]
MEKHDLIHEFPEHKDAIHELKVSNSHFRRLFDEYHEVDHDVHRVETGAENTDDDTLTAFRKKRLQLKDELFAILNEA